jgi:cobalt-zinc-cadmium resistance protein CzcA
LTWLPVVSSIFLKPEKENRKNISTRLIAFLYKTYCPVIRWAYDHKKIVLSMAVASLIFTAFLFSKMGAEFVPTLDEGDFVIQPVLKTGTSLSKTVEMTTQMEKILKDNFPEVEQIVCRIGAAEVPTDPMSMEEIDMIIKLKPRKEWVTASNKEELAEHFKEALSIIPGVEYEFTQPIEMRFNELITGVRADIAVKIFGEDLHYMSKVANEIKQLVEEIPGAADVVLEKTEGLPQMSVQYNRQKIAQYGLSIEELNRNLAMAFGGEAAGSVFEGEKRFDLVVRYQRENRTDIENVKGLCIPLPNDNFIPLSEVADITYTTGPAKISRDDTHRRVVVSVNVRNRDLQSVVTDIQQVIDKNINLRTGYYITYGGQFENLQNATRRLQLAVPVALLLIFIFLHFAFKSLKDALLIFTAIPLATVGGVLLLWLRGMPFSVSAGIGFIALFGVAVLNGIVLIEHLKALNNEGMTNMRELILKGTRERLRPVVLTAAAAALGFLPMAISTSAGAEVQRPLATVVIGGLFTSTLLTMVALPLLYAIFANVSGFDFKRFKMKTSIKSVIVLLILFPAANVFAQEPVVINLDKAIETALNHNLAIKASERQVAHSEALIPSAFEIDKLNVYYEYDQNNVADNGYPLGILGVEQGFNFPTVYTSMRKANVIEVSMASSMLEKQRLDVTRQVSQQYYHIVFLMNQIKEFEVVDSLFGRYTRASELRLEKGSISQLEFLNASALHQRVQTRMRQKQNDLNIALENLGVLMQFDSAFIINYEPLEVLEPPLSPSILSPDLQLMQDNIQLQHAMLNVERNRLLPDVNLGYFNGTNQYAGAKNYYGYMIGLGVPLFFGEQRSKIRSGKIAVEIAQLHYENHQQQLENRRSQLQAELVKYREAIDIYQSSGEELYRQLFSAAERSFSLGLIDYFQYLQSIENAIEIKTEHLINVSTYNRMVIELKYLSL